MKAPTSVRPSSAACVRRLNACQVHARTKRQSATSLGLGGKTKKVVKPNGRHIPIHNASSPNACQPRNMAKTILIRRLPNWLPLIQPTQNCHPLQVRFSPPPNQTHEGCALSLPRPAWTVPAERSVGSPTPRLTPGPVALATADVAKMEPSSSRLARIGPVSSEDLSACRICRILTEPGPHNQHGHTCRQAA